MKQIDRSVLGSDGQPYVKMAFSVADDPYVDTETMWVEVIGDGTFRLKNIPGWTFGLAVDDLITGRELDGVLRFTKLVSRTGHSTYRIAFQSTVRDPTQTAAIQHLRDLGCTLERLSDRVFAVDVPPDSDIYEVYAALEGAMSDAVWWFDELHCGHQT